MSRLSQAQSKLNDALAALESAHVNSGSETKGVSPLDSARLLADLQAVDAKVASAVDMINASLTAGNGDGDKR
jgi:hypothetical protein